MGTASDQFLRLAASRLLLSCSVATQRSWNNTDDEWASKTDGIVSTYIYVFRLWLAEYVSATIKKGSHVLVEGPRQHHVRTLGPPL